MTINALDLITKTAGCPQLWSWGKKQKLTHSFNDAQPGDIVLFDFNRNGTPDHVGIVRYRSGGNLYTVEGNTGNGSNTNGDGVYKRVRYKSQVLGLIRPRYTATVTGQMIVDTALGQVGYKEGRNNNNKYGVWYGMNNQPWCAIFVCWLFAHVKKPSTPNKTPESGKPVTVPSVYINPGHGNTDPGAVGKYSRTERQLNVVVAKSMFAYLKANYQCSLHMNTGKMESLAKICTSANNHKCDLFVSIHFNAGGGDGAEFLIHNNNRKLLGQTFEKRVKAIGQNSRGIKLRPDLKVLKLTNMPAILVECAFVDNKKDIRDWDEDAELKKMGIALAKATADYLQLKKK